VSIQKVLQCPFHWKRRPSGVSLEYPALENIPPVRVNRAEAAQNHDALKAISATVGFQNEVGLYFGLEAGNRPYDRAITMRVRRSRLLYQS